MAITALQMEKDLSVMNETVSRTSDLLDGGTKQQFREASGRYLEILANRIDLQRVRESGVEQLSRAEVEKIVGVNADRLIERAQDIRAREQAEASNARFLAERAADMERGRGPNSAIAPQSQRALPAERAVPLATEQPAARETREAAAAKKAARLVTEHPAQALPASLVQTDALAKSRADQDQLIDQLEADRLKGEGLHGQKIKGLP